MTMKLMYSAKNECYVFTKDGAPTRIRAGSPMDYGSKRKAVEAAESAGFHVDLVTGAVHTTSESDRATDYRGFKIERDSGRGGYLLHYPEGEGNPKSVKTLKAAKAYIDTYMGDSGTEGLSGGVGKAPPSPPSGFGKEKTREDYRKRIDWEGWAAAKAREDGHEAVAQGHDMARAAYITNYGLKVDGGLRGLDGVSKGTRQGTRVRFNANPGSLVLYSHHPEIGEEGTVGTMPGFGKRTYLPGPGGGLLYVDWDQSGMIGVSPNDVERVGWRGMEGLDGVPEKLDAFTRGYVEAALWSSTDAVDEPLDNTYDLSDIADETWHKILKDTAKFQKANAKDLSPFDSAQAGHDFWLTRNGHGAGFWDGDYPEPQATRLTKASEAFKGVDLYVGNDGKKLYLSP